MLSMTGVRRMPRRGRLFLRVFLMTIAATAAALAAPGVAAADSYRWRNDADGRWDVAGNWEPTNGSPAGFPDGPGDLADFPIFANAPYTVTIPAGRTITVGAISVGGGSSVTIDDDGGGRLTLFSGSPNDVLLLTNGNLRLDVRVELRSSLSVLTSEGVVTCGRTITEADSTGPHAITKSGPGGLIFEQPTLHRGATRIQEGQLTLRSTFGPALSSTGLLEIGDGFGGVLSASVIAPVAAQFHNFAIVQVNKDGFLSLNRPDRIANLKVRDGVVMVHSNGTAVGLTVPTLDMIGGLLQAFGNGQPETAEFLVGGIVATASPTSPAHMQGADGGALRINAAGGTTFTVNDGPGDVDLDLDIPVGGGGEFVKDGAGALRFSGTSRNTYPLKTRVRRGVLSLNRGSLPDGESPGGLVVGAGQGSAVVRIVGDFPRKLKFVDVAADGLIEVERSTIESEGVSIAGGGRIVLAHGTWSVDRDGIDFVGGGRLTIGPEAKVLVNPGLTGFVNNAPHLPVVIDGGGVLEFAVTGQPHLFVQDGPAPIDMRIDVRVGVSEFLRMFPIKVGPGAILFERSTRFFRFDVNAGVVLMNGTHEGSILINGGDLGGNGIVGDVTGAVGLLAPGMSPGQLTTGSLALGVNNRFAVELNGATPGSGYDRLVVRGTVNLGNAVLLAVPGPGFPKHATFTIIANDGNDPVVGRFAGLTEGAAIAIAGELFRVSYRGGDGNDVVLIGPEAAKPDPTPDPTPEPGPEPGPTPAPARVAYFLAEGATGAFFDEDVLIVNPNDAEAPVTLTFLRQDGSAVVERRTVAPQSRLTVHVDQISGLEATSVSVEVVSDKRLPLVVERSMFWDASYYGGHTTNAMVKPETRWIFAEGSQGFFDTYILIANANAEATTATLTFLRENDTPVVRTVPIGAFSRETVWAGAYPEIVGPAFGIVVDAPLPVIAERAMYFATMPNALWSGGHVNTGIVTPSTTWFHAEGATGTFFSTFILLSNPQDTAAQIELRFLLDTGEVITRNKTLAAHQRMTINPADEGDARLENAALSTVVQSDVPIVSERSMYWSGDAPPIGEGHNSSGVASTATRWGLAEGRVGGPRAFVTYILLANPSTTAADVTITYLRESGTPIVKTYTVPPTSRYNVDVNFAVPELQDASFGARIEVTNNVPIAVERSVYWNANGVSWAGGTNALGTPLP